MIRIWIEGGQQAIFGDREMVTVCKDVIDGEYIVDERHEHAWEVKRRWFKGDQSYPYIFLDKDNFTAAVKHGEANNWYEGIYRIVKVETLPDQMPAFLEKQ